MIKSVSISNFGPIKEFNFNGFEKINLIIGPNRSGKTILMKALYTAQKTIERFGRGKNIDPIKDILFKKLYWTFQVDQIGELVRRPANGHLSFCMKEKSGGEFSYSFSPATEKQIVNVESTCSPRNENSIFIPAKEILSLRESVIHDREVREVFSYDDTYYDLAKALTPTVSGKLSKAFVESRMQLEKAIDGHIYFSKNKQKWVFAQGKGNTEFDISLTSEGTKKIGIFDTLIGNHYLTSKSVIFIDEPESGLHPSLLVNFLDILEEIAKAGAQLFIASHSYFVIKKLYLIAQTNPVSVPVISFTDGGIVTSNLKDGMPDNPIIDQSIKLYEQEITL